MKERRNWDTTGWLPGITPELPSSEEKDRYLLKKALDPQKDSAESRDSYSMTQEQLSRTLFPLGEVNDKGSGEDAWR